MGLDQYLHRKTYVKNWNNMKPEELHVVTVTKGGKAVKEIDPKKIAYIVEEVAYWRKAYAIQNWFENNVQDDEGNFHVSVEQLKELVEICKTVINTKDKSLLPSDDTFTVSGIGTDEWYFEDLKNTVKMLTPYLADENAEFEYSASW